MISINFKRNIGSRKRLEELRAATETGAMLWKEVSGYFVAESGGRRHVLLPDTTYVASDQKPLRACDSLDRALALTLLTSSIRHNLQQQAIRTQPELSQPLAA
jgi:hypothetical protein